VKRKVLFSNCFHEKHSLQQNTLLKTGSCWRNVELQAAKHSLRQEGVVEMLNYRQQITVDNAGKCCGNVKLQAANSSAYTRKHLT
jgi:uncharacterized protein YcgI (DUF1989 family)